MIIIIIVITIAKKMSVYKKTDSTAFDENISIAMQAGFYLLAGNFPSFPTKISIAIFIRKVPILLYMFINTPRRYAVAIT